jgi:hypothetical protein
LFKGSHHKRFKKKEKKREVSKKEKKKERRRLNLEGCQDQVLKIIKFLVETRLW